MTLRYAIRSVALVLTLALASSEMCAQGDTCTTALQVVTGVHMADGPSTGWAGPSCGGGNNGDWYVYTPSFTGTITITSCHPLNSIGLDDTYLKVYSGTCAQLACIGYNDDMLANACPDFGFASYMEVSVVAGQNYYIVWTNLFNSNSFYWELNECVGTVTGVTYADNNDNAIRDLGEGQVDVMLQVQPEGSFVFAGQDPYSFCSNAGPHTVTIPTPPLYHTVVPVSRSYDITTQGQQVTGVDFALQSIPGIFDASASIWGWNPWIGNNTTLHLTYANIGTETVNASLQLALDPLLTFVSATTTATSVSGQVITWALGPLAAGASGTITVTIHTSETAAPNAPVLNTVTISTTESDVNAANNTDDQHTFATTSFDPNDKQVDFTTLTPEDVIDRKPLEYTIRFQNTGTAPAVNVVIRDLIHVNADLGTFEMIGASHPYSLSILNGEAMWTFANIMLPDSSTDQLGSQGSINYRITPKDDLVIGDQVTNRADIYFDFNEPVLTNTVVTDVALLTGLADAATLGAFRIHPSPSTGNITLRWMNGTVSNGTLTVMDALGRTVYTSRMDRSLDASGTTLDLSSLPGGTYAAWLQGDGVDSKARFVIHH